MASEGSDDSELENQSCSDNRISSQDSSERGSAKQKQIGQHGSSRSADEKSTSKRGHVINGDESSDSAMSVLPQIGHKSYAEMSSKHGGSHRESQFSEIGRSAFKSLESDDFIKMCEDVKQAI